MTYLSTHTIGFTIGTTDWIAEIECDGTGYTLQSVSMDVAGKAMGCIEGEDLDRHYGQYEYHDQSTGILSFSNIVVVIMSHRLSDILARHEDEKGQNAIDSAADRAHDRQQEKDMGYE